MITAAFLQEILFRKWIFTWLAPYSKTAVLVSTGLFCLFHMPTNPVSYTHLDVYKRQVLTHLTKLKVDGCKT